MDQHKEKEEEEEKTHQDQDQDMIQKMWQDGQEFAMQYLKSTEKTPHLGLDAAYICKNIQDEIQEFTEAKNLTQQVDALLDAVYYIMDHLAKSNEEVKQYVTRELNMKHVFEYQKYMTSHLLFCASKLFTRSEFQMWSNDHVQAYKKSVEVYCANFILNTNIDMMQQVDALCDLIYEFLALCYSRGIHIYPIWLLIHQANMTKFGPGGHLDKSDPTYKNPKWIKPLTFVPPDAAIEKELQRQKDDYLSQVCG
jgi:predicted HAD superfamily Cof-like phosphohydrolase